MRYEILKALLQREEEVARLAKVELQLVMRYYYCGT